MKKLKAIIDKIVNTFFAKIDKLPFHPTLIFLLTFTILIGIIVFVLQIVRLLIEGIIGEFSINELFSILEFQDFLRSILISLGFGLFVSAIYILMNAKLFFINIKDHKERKINKHMEITNKRKKKKRRRRK